MTFAEFIRAKGLKSISSTLNTPENTIYTWVSRRSIPRAVWPELLLAYPELGLNDLLGMEAAGKEDA